ncbi:MAG: cysteine ase [Lasallia pustulata]|uniref:Cysteine ase n=1 Tax=Lasallia pustulata TaxID=136370 RepID=A0A5M8PY67_9LECA|nr:MAG: cysteine ase [Lasallia pustulata]
MEELQKRHRQEQKDLQSRITQKKKSATKKTRKGVNEECEQLERQLRDRQESELSLLSGTPPNVQTEQDADEEQQEEPLQGNADHGDDLDKTSISALAASSTISQARKPNRQKARLARRAAEQEAAAAKAAEEATNLPDLREKERVVMSEAFKKYGLKEKAIRPDGHCMYSAVADQLNTVGVAWKPNVITKPTPDSTQHTAPDYKFTREAAAAYISEHPEDFLPFLEEPLDEYTTKIRDTAEWGGQLELLALSKVYGVNINVLQGDGRVEKIEPKAGGGDTSIWLAYYRHTYGLGEHYNSLQRGP